MRFYAIDNMLLKLCVEHYFARERAVENELPSFSFRDTFTLEKSLSPQDMLVKLK